MVLSLLIFSPTLVFLWVFVHYEKWPSTPGLLALVIYPVLSIFIFGQDWYFFSHHSLMHASIVYQIMENGIPPTHPFLAGEPLYYAWGYHALCAIFCTLLNLPPQAVFALVNLVATVCCAGLIYRISNLLFPEKARNILSVLIALYAMSMIEILFSGHYDTFILEFRGLPFFKKLPNANGAPGGLVFYLLTLYSLIRLTQKTTPRYYILFAIGFLGCGFFYMPFLPGTLAGICIYLVTSVCLKNLFRVSIRALVNILLIMGGCCLLLYPYFASFHAGISSSVELFNIIWLKAHLFHYVFQLLPLGIIFIWSRRFWLKKTDFHGLLLLSSFIFANFLCFLCFHFPNGNEYKFFILSTVPVGIIGGLAIYETFRWKYRWMVFLMLVCFLLPTFQNFRYKLNLKQAGTLQYKTQGNLIDIQSKEHSEYYGWIRENTSKDAIFLDEDLLIPLISHRQLYIATQEKQESGFVAMKQFLNRINGYDLKITETRKKLLLNSKDPTLSFSKSQKVQLQKLGDNLYLVAYLPTQKERFFNEGFEEVYASDALGRWIFQVAP